MDSNGLPSNTIQQYIDIEMNRPWVKVPLGDNYVALVIEWVFLESIYLIGLLRYPGKHTELFFQNLQIIKPSLILKRKFSAWTRIRTRISSSTRYQLSHPDELLREARMFLTILILASSRSAFGWLGRAPERRAWDTGSKLVYWIINIIFFDKLF